MFATLKNAWKIPDIRKRILYTLLMILIFRLGSAIPVAGIDSKALAALFQTNQEGFMGLFNIMSGGSFSNFTIFALGIGPYITASIVLNLLQMAIPALEELAREGEVGRKKIAQYTRYLTVVLAIIQGIGFSVGYFRSVFRVYNFMSVFIAVLTLTAGSAVMMYLGEKITENGIGNGMSLFIFAGIVASLPEMTWDSIGKLKGGVLSIWGVLAFLVVCIIVVMGVVFIQEGTRKIPVQHSKRVVGRKVYGGNATHVPLKVNQAGVIPIIFAISIMMVPMTIAQFMPQSGYARFIAKYFGSTSIAYNIVYLLLIIGFTYFYTSVTFNPVDIADRLKQSGGYVPGIRPGKPTSDFLKKTVNRISFAGAIFLAIMAFLPNLLGMLFPQIRIGFGGTSLLILVSVALETMKQIEAQMMMRHYEGFLG